MTPTEMEDVLRSCDQRLPAIEQILPTLATKQDLERFATKEDLRDGVAEAKRHADVLTESVRDNIRIVAEGVATVAAKLDALSGRVESLTDRLQRRGVI